MLTGLCLQWRNGLSYFKTYLYHLWTESYEHQRKYSHEGGGTLWKSLTLSNNKVFDLDHPLVRVANPEPHKEGRWGLHKFHLIMMFVKYNRTLLLISSNTTFIMKAIVETPFLKISKHTDSVTNATSDSLRKAWKYFQTDWYYLQVEGWTLLKRSSDKH